MGAVPRLMQWTHFVRDLGGYVVLDFAWNSEATAEFSDDQDGPLSVVCGLDEAGDIDVGRKPRLDGEKIRGHRRLAQAFAAFAYVNPGSSGDGETVSRDAHQGEWYELEDNLAVAVAGPGGVGGVDTGGRGAYLVHKGRVWLPFGVQESRTEPARPEVQEQPEEILEVAEHGGLSAQSGPAEESAATQPLASVTPLEEAPSSTRPRPPARHAQPVKPRERRGRVFGDATDDLIQQARSAGRRRA